MNSRGLKKKPATSPLKPNNSKKKSKSKSKSKEKSKKFLPQDFLQALIDLQNTRCSTNKKKRNTTRDISSALTVATPALEKTISASKIRSRSSFSQYRKKCNGGNKQPLAINLCEIITEEDNVQYTEKTARSSSQQEQKKLMMKIHIQKDLSRKKLNENQCAIKIQRAWRNYQTYKILHQIFLREKRIKEQKKNNVIQNVPHQLHIKIKKPDLQKTLKIKKEHAIKKEQRMQQSYEQTKKIIEERCKQKQMEDSQKDIKSPIDLFSHQSQDSISNLILTSSPNTQQEQIIKRMKERQAQRFAEVINLIQKQTMNKSKTKQELVNELIQKFQTNKKILEKDLDSQEIKLEINAKQSQPEQIKSRQSYFSSDLISPQFKPHNKINNLSPPQPQFWDQQDPLSLKSVKNSSSQNSLCLDFEYTADQMEELKIFDQRLKMIKSEKLNKLEKIDDILLQSRMTDMEALQRKEKVYNFYDTQKKEIEKNRKQFIFSLTKLKKCAIKCQKSGIKQSSSFSKLRKSFSVGNTIIKSLIQDIKLGQFEISQQQPQFIKYIFKRDERQPEEGEQKPLTNTPILNLPSPNKNTQSEEQLLDKNNNTQVLKQYSQQIQELIQKQLIQQYVVSSYLDENIFRYLKPYVQQVYQFKKVSDVEIMNYLSSIRTYFPHEGIMLIRVNQKVNPTTEQILRIIRDLEYEADQYELIIPQQCFKKYRAQIEKKYEEMNKQKRIRFDEIKQKVKNEQLALRIYQIEEEKNEKVKKYRNFERDLKIMYMKAVFNCINEYLIELKSSNAFMNGRSSIGPGQLTLAMKEYNEVYQLRDYYKLLNQVDEKIKSTISIKCSIPCFKNYHDIELFQKQVMKQIQIDSTQGQFKWVNYMDEILQIWQDLCTSISQSLFQEAALDLRKVIQ